MIWIFAAVALIIAVYHKGFRTLLYWLGGLGVAAFLLIGILVH